VYRRVATLVVSTDARSATAVAREIAAALDAGGVHQPEEAQ
jgi:hypothetical protein